MSLPNEVFIVKSEPNAFVEKLNAESSNLLITSTMVLDDDDEQLEHSNNANNSSNHNLSTSYDASLETNLSCEDEAATGSSANTINTASIECSNSKKKRRRLGFFSSNKKQNVGNLANSNSSSSSVCNYYNSLCIRNEDRNKTSSINNSMINSSDLIYHHHHQENSCVTSSLLVRPELQKIMPATASGPIVNELVNGQFKIPLIIKYFYYVNSISANGESIKGKCKYCSYEFNCKMKPTSNFSKHAQTHDNLFIDYLKTKEMQSKRKYLNSPQFNNNNNNNNNNIINNAIQKSKNDNSWSFKSKKQTNHEEFGRLHTNHYDGTFISLTTVTASEPRSTSALPSLTTDSIEQKIARFFLNSLIDVDVIESNYFNEFIVELLGASQQQQQQQVTNSAAFNFKTISKTKLLTQLIPQLFEQTELKIKQSIASNITLDNSKYYYLYYYYYCYY
jgi:hypothetical protein